MGCTSSKPTTVDNHISQIVIPKVDSDLRLIIDEEIDTAQETARQNDDDKVKMLLLGTGESGKSTIFKQFRILYGSPRTDDDLRMCGVVVRSNIITAVRKLCMLARSMGYDKKLEDESELAMNDNRNDACGMTSREAYDHIMSYLVDNTATTPFPDISPERLKADWVGKSLWAGQMANDNARLFLQHAEAIRILWQVSTILYIYIYIYIHTYTYIYIYIYILSYVTKIEFGFTTKIFLFYIYISYQKSKSIQELWMHRAKANIIDSHNKFFNDLTRIASPEYRPTEADILISRVRTSQVTVERYIIEGIEFEVYDVGGQRSERRKWIDCFDGVDAVIFVAALSEYDQVLAEAKRQNRMVEALNLFHSVVKNAHFSETSILLFLNKKDIFAEKIMYSHIEDSPHFSDYAGPPQDFDHAVLYFIQKFEEYLDEDEFSDSFIHVTNATDTTNMEFVLDSTRMIIMSEVRYYFQ